MKCYSLLLITILQVVSLAAQERLVDSNYIQYFDWFHQNASTTQLYQKDSQLFIFKDQTALRRSPDEKASVAMYLSSGAAVTNLAYDSGQDSWPEDQINGYGDLWYRVAVQLNNGESLTGYVWGVDIAKDWQYSDIDQDNEEELILLGVSTQPRQSIYDIRSELCILKNNQELAREHFDKLCLFEDCASSAMLTVHQMSKRPVIEITTLTVVCEVAVEQVFFSFENKSLRSLENIEPTLASSSVGEQLREALNTSVVSDR